jgi:calcineurin-like phosphoesterase family protein
VIEQVAERVQEEELHEPEDVVIKKFQNRLKRQGQDWLIEQLLWAMNQDHEIFKTIAERLFYQRPSK